MDPQYRYLIDTLEKVQRRFTKRLNALRHLSFADRLQVLSLESLERRQVNCDLIFVYKMLHGLTACTSSHNLTLQEFNKTRMWANAQRDGRPAEYRWHPLFNAAKFG